MFKKYIKLKLKTTFIHYLQFFINPPYFLLTWFPPIFFLTPCYSSYISSNPSTPLFLPPELIYSSSIQERWNIAFNIILVHLRFVYIWIHNYTHTLSLGMDGYIWQVICLRRADSKYFKGKWKIKYLCNLTFIDYFVQELSEVISVRFELAQTILNCN